MLLSKSRFVAGCECLKRLYLQVHARELAAQPDEADEAIMTRNGTPLKSGDVNRDVLKPLCKQVGIPVGTMHAFRHGRVSAMESGGTPRKIIKLEIGHSSLRMTDRYTHFTPEQRKATAEKLAV